MKSRYSALNATHKLLSEIHGALYEFETDKILNKVRALIEPAIAECEQEFERMENDNQF